MAHMVNYDKMWAKNASKGYKSIGTIFKGALGLGAFLLGSSTTKTSKTTTRKSKTTSKRSINKVSVNTPKKANTSDFDIYPISVDLNNLDPMFEEVARYVVTKQEGSTSRLQRTFELGYNRAEKISDQLEAAGIVGPNKGPKGRDVLIQDLDSLDKILQELKNHNTQDNNIIESPVESLDIKSNTSSLDLSPSYIDLAKLDPMFEEVARYVVTKQEGSTSRLQRAFDLGYNRAGKISDQLEAAGIVGPNKGPKGRDVLIQSIDDLEKKLLELKLKDS